MIPKDPVILLSFLNTQLRDYYSSLEECCSNLDINQQEIVESLGRIDYYYDEKQNQFI